MDVDFLPLRRIAMALPAVVLAAGGMGCSPVDWGVNEVKSLTNHHSSNATTTTPALEAAAALDAGETPTVQANWPT